MPRYALLRHEVPASFGRPSHWDLLLEHENACRTWALESLPKTWAERLDLGPANTDTVIALPLADHRLHYLTYEGPVSGDRGTVARQACGEYESTSWGSSLVQVTFESGNFCGCSIELRESATEWTLRATD